MPKIHDTSPRPNGWRVFCCLNSGMALLKNHEVFSAPRIGLAEKSAGLFYWEFYEKEKGLRRKETLLTNHTN